MAEKHKGKRWFICHECDARRYQEEAPVCECDPEGGRKMELVKPTPMAPSTSHVPAVETKKS
jgi:hypothetical protein